MNPTTYEALIALNRDFYTGFADAFARTRRSWPLGFTLILPYLQPAANVLDLGCGNGRLLAFLAARGWAGDYLGLDSSAGLLAEAQALAAAYPQVQAGFVQADLLGIEWCDRVRATAGTVEAITCLAVLHHIPGAANRARFLAQCKTLLAPGGRLVVSTWQFMTSERLCARVLPWETVGLRTADLEAGDYLLAWGQGAVGRRYCAFLNLEALASLAEEAGLAIDATHYADGHEGNLNLYAVLTAR